MSTKKQHLYNMAWWKLCELHHTKARAVSAGEFAVKMGIARSTALRWLEEMTAEGGCMKSRTTGRNHLPAVIYAPVGYSAWLDQQKYIEQEQGE